MYTCFSTPAHIPWAHSEYITSMTQSSSLESSKCHKTYAKRHEFGYDNFREKLQFRCSRKPVVFIFDAFTFFLKFIHFFADYFPFIEAVRINHVHCVREKDPYVFWPRYHFSPIFGSWLLFSVQECPKFRLLRVGRIKVLATVYFAPRFYNTP